MKSKNELKEMTKNQLIDEVFMLQHAFQAQLNKYQGIEAVLCAIKDLPIIHGVFGNNGDD